MKRPQKVAGALALALAFAMTGGARPARTAVPPVRKLTLAECLAIAQGQNPNLLATMAAEQAARWRYYQARADSNPTLAVSSYRRRQTVPPALGNFTFGSPDLIDENVQINGTVWSFGRLEAQQHARRQLARAAKADTEDFRKTLRFQVTEVFYAVQLARALVAVATSTVEQVQRQLDQAQRQFDAGTAARFDVVRAKTALANARPPLIRQRANERVARQTLLTAMGVPGDFEFELAGDFDTRPMPYGQMEVVNLAYRSRSDLQALLTRHRASLESVRAAKAADNPNVTFNIQNDDSLGQRPPFNSFVEINSAQVSVNIPVFDGGQSRALTGEARSEAKRAVLLIQQLRNAIRLEVVQALARLEEAKAVIESSSEAVAEADESVEIAEAGYEQGLRTNLEVLDAQLARATARTNHAQARHDFAVARARLERVMGRTIPDDPSAARAAAAAAKIQVVN